MYYLLHRQKVPDHVTKMPEGLPDLMSDISREVLRVQPEPHCVYKFVADYLDALLHVREKAFVAQTIIDELIQTSESVSNFLRGAGICHEKANRAAEVIQAAFHEFMKKKRGEKPEGPKQFNEIELLTELINKCKFTQKEIERSRPAIRHAYRQFVNDYLQLMKTTVYGAAAVVPIVRLSLESSIMTSKLEQLNQAATIIQASFRGHLTRQSLRRSSLQFEIFLTRVVRRIFPSRRSKRFEPIRVDKYECVRDQMALCKYNKAASIIQRSFRRWFYKLLYHYDFPYPILTRAATIIQSRIRGYLTRKSLPDQKRLSIEKRYSSITDECQLWVLNTSALKIQTIYRGYRTRKNYKHELEMQKFALIYKQDPDKEKEFNRCAAIIQRAYRRFKKKKSKKLDFADIVVEAAALKIQALFRGYIARKRFQKMKQEKQAQAIAPDTQKPGESEELQALEKVEPEQQLEESAAVNSEEPKEEKTQEKSVDDKAETEKTTEEAPAEAVAHEEATPEEPAAMNESEAKGEAEQTQEVDTTDKIEEEKPTEITDQTEAADVTAEAAEEAE